MCVRVCALAHVYVAFASLFMKAHQLIRPSCRARSSAMQEEESKARVKKNIITLLTTVVGYADTQTAQPSISVIDLECATVMGTTLPASD